MTNYINPEQVSFKTIRESYMIKLTRDEVADMCQMLFYCLSIANQTHDMELEMLILEELRITMNKKRVNCSSKTSMKLTRSQARTLFLWLNLVRFEHRLHENLSIRLVDQLYKQIV